MIRVPVGSSGAFVILVHGADPDGGETCVLDIVEVFPDGIPGPTTPSRMRNETIRREQEETKYQVWSAGLQAVGSAPVGSA